MRKQALLSSVCFVLLLFAGAAHAYTLSTGFDGVSVDTANLTTTSGLNQWHDLGRWAVASSGGNSGSFAVHMADSQESNNLLFYGFDAAGLGSGSSYQFQFDFINTFERSNYGAAYIGGLKAGQGITMYAPWPDLSTTYFLKATLDKGVESWTTKTFSGIIPKDYDVIYVAFDMGGTTGTRGIDNVLLQVNPVPEPSTIILLAAGIGGVALLRRKKAKC